ncbi:MAG: tyrosine-protein phosphatase [Butyricicoccaceae bacterium]
MVDLHAHILPELDDGSNCMGDSLEMAAMALESGVHTLVATPHSNQMNRFENFDSEDLRQRFREFCGLLKEEGLPLEVFLGMEIFASGDLEENIRSGRLISLNGSRYYLVEFGFEERPEAMEEYLGQIFAAGGVPLIAHPERYVSVQRDPEMVYEWQQDGCLIQINKGSLLGRFGRRARAAAHLLLDNGLVTCVASDAHSPYMRTTWMADIRDYIEERIGEETAYILLHRNPKRILFNETITPHGRPPERRKRFLF